MLNGGVLGTTDASHRQRRSLGADLMLQVGFLTPETSHLLHKLQQHAALIVPYFDLLPGKSSLYSTVHANAPSP